MKPVTVPFFISHQGCPHSCIFCDQRLINGSDGNILTSEEIIGKINTWSLTAGERPLEVAFFGGTFTALPAKRQEELLAPLQSLLGGGRIKSVRLSTRPDYINDGIVAWLAERGVRTIELGVQSMDDAVLAASGRGHTAAESEDAIRCIRKHGVAAGVQLMPGLPADTPMTSLASLKKVIAAGADFLRIYPTVVLRGTELARRYANGEYIPLAIQEGVSLCKMMLHRAMQSGIPVIRIGLQSDEGLNNDTVVAGCWHPAFGQMVRSELYADLLDRFVPCGQPVTVQCHPDRISDLLGFKRSNFNRLSERGAVMLVVPDVTLDKEMVRVKKENSSVTYSIITDLNYSMHEV